MKTNYFLQSSILFKTAIFIIAVLFNTGILAQSVKTEHVEAELISEVKSVKPGQPFWIALRIKHNPEWHTYWRNAGDAGLETRIAWEMPEGFKAGEIKWPYPEIISSSFVTSYGHYGDHFLLTKITPPDQINPNEITIVAYADWLVCKIVCVPENAKLSLNLPVKTDPALTNEKWVDAFARARNKLPIKDHQWKFLAEKTDSSVIIKAVKPEIADSNPGNIRFFPYSGGIFNNSEKQIIKRTKEGFELEVNYQQLKLIEPDKLLGILVSENGWRGQNSERAIEIDLPFGKNIVSNSANESGVDLLLALIFAFIGGIILNVMPCVLPVLSIKILGFIQHNKADNKNIIEQGIFFTIGVIFSFITLAALMLILRAGGEQLGWGFQLQTPTFLIILSISLFLFGLSLLGVFEIGTSIVKIGDKLELKSRKSGALISGVATTVLATPCTAPFMGSALGFALTQPVAITLSVFVFLGLGMAFPYLLLSIFPQWLKYIPKPGRWMETLKQFMGFLLIGTVIWLAWILGLQTGVDGLIGLLTALLFCGIAAWVYGKWGNFINKLSTRILAVNVALFLIIGSTIFLFLNIDTNYKLTDGSVNSGSGLKWEEFSPGRLTELRNEDKPVFLDFTAAWCLSCQVNEKVALSSGEVIKKFKEKGIVALKADWTNRDEVIAKTLADFGRNSVPLYVLYYGKPSTYKILPEILTPGIVLEAIDKL